MILRLGVFGLCLLGLLYWEARRPARPAARRRWAGNIALGALDAGLLRLTVTGGLAGVASWGQAAGVGLLAGSWAALPVGLLALDLAIYWQHRLMHCAPWLWSWHRVHHTDAAMDVSTALRFHPIEALLSLGLKAAVVLGVGMPAAGALAFELWLSACALFNHANARLPTTVERRLRWVLITPDLHRIHHRVRPHEHHSNFGFSVCWWDRLLGSWCPQVQGGDAALRLGLASHPAPRGLLALLAEPFRGSQDPADPPPIRESPP